MPAFNRETVASNPLSDQTEREGVEFAHFFDHSRDLLCIAGFDGNIKRLNPAWTRKLGWPREALESRSLLDFVHPEDRGTTRTKMEALAEGANTTMFENRCRHRDGSYLSLLWNARPVPQEERIYTIARDVTRERRLERQILDIADREKDHFSQELHDGLCQNLSGIAALSSALSKRLERVSNSAAVAAAEITHLLNEAIQEARDLARGLGPIGLREAGLEGALETLAINTAQRFRVTCRLESDCNFIRLGQKVEVHLFRIAQEAVNNALTHGQASRIDIALANKYGVGLLSVRDNGTGLPAGSHNLDGIGLHTMAYRAHIIGGSLNVRPRSVGGTAVTCAFPLREAEKIHED